MECPVGSCHDALAQSQGEVQFHRHLGVDGEGSIRLHRHQFLVVEAYADAHEVTPFLSSNEYHSGETAAVRLLHGIVDDTIVRKLIEQVQSHGGRNEVRTVAVNAVSLVQSELRADKLLVALRHVFKAQLSDFVAVHVFYDGFRRDEDAWTGLEVTVLFQSLLQGDDLVPMGHSGLFTPAYEGVNGR